MANPYTRTSSYIDRPASYLEPMGSWVTLQGVGYSGVRKSASDTAYAPEPVRANPIVKATYTPPVVQSNATAPLGSAERTQQLLAQATKITGIPVTTFTEPQKPVQLPTPAPDTTNYGAELNYATNPTTPAGGLPDYLKQYLDATAASNKETADLSAKTYDDLYGKLDIGGKEAGVTQSMQAELEAKKQLDMIGAELEAIKGQTTQDVLRLRGEGISMAGIGSRTMNLEREAAIRAIPLQAQALVAQANLANAQGNTQLSQDILSKAEGRLDTLFGIHIADAERTFTNNQKLRDAVFNYATKEEQRLLDEQKLKDERAYNERRDAINNANDLAKEAIKNGQAGLASQLMGLNPNSPTYQQDVAKVAGQIVKKDESAGLTAAQINATINQIAGSFDNEQIVKDYNAATAQYQLMNQLGTGGKSPGDDIAFVYAFAKLMDPNSVVREGEYATVQKYAQSFLDAKTLEAIRLAKNTNFLTADAKQKLLTTSYAKMQVLNTQYQNLQTQYQQRIDTAKTGGMNTLTNYGNAFDLQAPTGNVQGVDDQEANNILNDVAGNSSNQSSPLWSAVREQVGIKGTAFNLNNLWNWLQK